MMIRLAVFDLDGTLLNTLDDLAAAGNYALAKNGLPTHNVQAYKAFIGNGVHILIKRAVPVEYRDIVTVLHAVLADFQDYYAAHGQDLTQPYPGIPQLLSRIRAKGMQVAVLSNKPHIHVVPLVEHYFPGLVDMSLGQRDKIPHKPDPYGLLEILQHLKLSKEECAYIGDSGVDAQTGKNAQIYTIGVTWGFCPKEELVSQGVSVTVNKVEELEALLVDKSGNPSYTGT